MVRARDGVKTEGDLDPGEERSGCDLTSKTGRISTPRQSCLQRGQTCGKKPGRGLRGGFSPGRAALAADGGE